MPKRDKRSNLKSWVAVVSAVISLLIIRIIGLALFNCTNVDKVICCFKGLGYC